MHARVAVASNAVSTEGIAPATANLIHRSLLEAVNAHGRLVFSDEPDLRELVRVIKSDEGIPPDARALWVETLTRLRKHERIKILASPDARLSSIRALEEVRLQWGSEADLAVVAESFCQDLGISLSTGLMADPNATPDVATAPAATNTPALQRVVALEQNSIVSTGRPRDDFWRDVLRPLATDATAATILDRYLFGTIWKMAANRPAVRHIATEHIVWLLEHLDDVMAPGAGVHLIGDQNDRNDGVSADATADLIRRSWGPTTGGRLREVTLTITAPPQSGKFPHDRHIRFSTASAIEISAGFDRLREDSVTDPDGMKWKHYWRPNALGVLQASEDRARSYARETATVLTRQ